MSDKHRGHSNGPSSSYIPTASIEELRRRGADLLQRIDDAILTNTRITQDSASLHVTLATLRGALRVYQDDVDRALPPGDKADHH